MEKIKNDDLMRGMCWGLSIFFLAAAVGTAVYGGDWEQVYKGFVRIIGSPSALITDYFKVGGLSATLFNAGLCTFACCCIVRILKCRLSSSFFASYILLLAHCFYGMNLLNIWPCFIGVALYYHHIKKNIRDHIHIAIFSMAFAPLISELLFRYPLGDAFVAGEIQITAAGIILAGVFGLMAGFVLPGMLEGASRMHKGYNLYNGGLAFGLVGGFIYAFLYKTMGLTSEDPVELVNPLYDGTGDQYIIFWNVMFGIILISTFIAGYILNGRQLKNYNRLLSETGHRTNYAQTYGMPLCMINFGLYGLMILLYMDAVFLLTDGVAFTGPTVGAMFAALTFAVIGQHPKNTWSIFGGYVFLYIIVAVVCALQGRPVPWTLSTQGYINGVAFATGLAPIAGRYGWKAGIAAGAVSAALCTSTGAFHGGFMIFNGGFTAGITALIMVSVLEHHYPHMEVNI